MYEDQNDLHLFAELYDVHPQAIVWSKPIWNEVGTAIVDFAYSYYNDEGLRYLNITREQQQQGLYISNSPTLTPEMQQAFLQERIGVYLHGNKTNVNLYNPILKKYARVLRTRLRGGAS